MICKASVCWIAVFRGIGIIVVVAVMAAGCEGPPAERESRSEAPPSASISGQRSEASSWTPAADSSGPARAATPVRRVGADLSGPLKAADVDKTQDDVRVVLMEVSRMVIFAQSRDPLLVGKHEAGIYATPAAQIRYMVEFKGRDTITDYETSIDRLSVGNVALACHPEVSTGEMGITDSYENTLAGGFISPRVGNPKRVAMKTSTIRGALPAGESMDVTVKVVKNSQAYYVDFKDIPF